MAVDHGAVAGHDVEGIGAGGRGRVEQRPHRDGVLAVDGPQDPELAEGGKLLGLAGTGVDGEATRRRAVDLAAADGAEVARAQEGRDFVELVPPVQRMGELEARQRQLLGRRLEAGVAEIELVGRDEGRRFLALLDDAYLDRLVVDEARREELDMEQALGATPKRFVGAGAQGAVVVVGELAHVALDRGDVLIGLRRQPLRQCCDRVECQGAVLRQSRRGEEKAKQQSKRN